MVIISSAASRRRLASSRRARPSALEKSDGRARGSQRHGLILEFIIVYRFRPLEIWTKTWSHPDRAGKRARNSIKTVRDGGCEPHIHADDDRGGEEGDYPENRAWPRSIMEFILLDTVRASGLRVDEVVINAEVVEER